MARRKQETNRVDEMLDELLTDCQTPEDILGGSGWVICPWLLIS